ncbi:hypothetical protein [Leeuwenhoekiella sp. NPDC079379]|uniref:hypothetical protein n=1 Tax=Leeuwenhoekiella sp. NPDC079379 TaxID=3364122 RepID=UPI0037C92FB9
MEVLVFQVGIFLAIIVLGAFGKKIRNGALIFFSVFTVVMVFTSGLMILQFLTIFLAYLVTDGLYSKKEENINDVYIPQKNNDKESKGCLRAFFWILLIFFIWFLYKIFSR